MYHFNYVTAQQLSPVRDDLIRIMNSVQNLVRREFTFRYDFVGSVVRNMVTCDERSSTGFDLDVDILVNDGGHPYPAKEIRTGIKNALDQAAVQFGYDYAEDSTRVLTIKMKDRQRAEILHSCDFAIVRSDMDGKGSKRQSYIHFDKKQNKYTWRELSRGYYSLPEKEQWVQINGYWNQMRELYLYKKNSNQPPGKSSQSIYAETIHEICQKYGYYR